MRDYNVYIPHHRDLQFLEDQRKRDDRLVNMLAIGASVFALVVLIWMVCVMAADAVVKSAENQERYYAAPVTATYQRPAAYRLASPTPAEMDHLDHVRQIAQVRR